MDRLRLTARLACCLTLAWVAPPHTTAATVAAARLEVRDHCRSGFAGTLAGHDGVEFSVCPDQDAPDRCHARVNTLHGSPFIEVLADRDSIEVRLAGVPVSPERAPDAEALLVIERVVRSPAAQVGATLFDRLAAAGRRTDSPAMRCLALAMPAFEWAATPYASVGGSDCSSGCNSTSGGCIGCCGAGCAGTGQTPGFGGCGTACTSSCKAHDLCAHATGTNWGPCTQSFAAAAVSLWKCMHRRPSFGCGTVPLPGNPPLPCICCDL